MTIHLTKQNLNALCGYLKNSHIRPLLIDRYQCLEVEYYELHIKDSDIPDLIKATTQHPDYDNQLFSLLNHINQL